VVGFVDAVGVWIDKAGGKKREKGWAFLFLKAGCWSWLGTIRVLKHRNKQIHVLLLVLVKAGIERQRDIGDRRLGQPQIRNPHYCEGGPSPMDPWTQNLALALL
jgi:hypothetical protein